MSDSERNGPSIWTPTPGNQGIDISAPRPSRGSARLLITLAIVGALATIAAIVLGAVLGTKLDRCQEDVASKSSDSPLAAVGAADAACSSLSVTVTGSELPRTSGRASASASASTSASGTASTAFPTPSSECRDYSDSLLITAGTQVDKYSVHCGTNTWGFDLIATRAYSMTECLHFCTSYNYHRDSHPDNSCGGIVFDPDFRSDDGGNCFLKNSTNIPIAPWAPADSAVIDLS